MISRTLWLCSVAVIGSTLSLRAADGSWKSLFNGKDLSGWETYLAKPSPKTNLPGLEKDEKGAYTKPLGVNNDPLHVFSVAEVDGQPAIHVTGEVIGTLTSLESFSDYHLKLEFKWGEKRWTNPTKPRNGGFLYHAHGKEGDVSGNWMHSHQFQVQEGLCGQYISTGDTAIDVKAKRVPPHKFVYDPAGEPFSFYAKSPNGERCDASENFEKPTGQWNTFEIISLGTSVIHVINGHVILRATNSRQLAGDSSKPLSGGQLQVQDEGSEMYFRHLQIQPITQVPAEFAEK